MIARILPHQLHRASTPFSAPREDSMPLFIPVSPCSSHPFSIWNRAGLTVVHFFTPEPADRTRTINLCGAFWSIPSERVASKFQTNIALRAAAWFVLHPLSSVVPAALIHEMSHFNDVAATRDIVYGEEGCLRLARRQPHQARELHFRFSSVNPSFALT